jgi:hypothetical protein
MSFADVDQLKRVSESEAESPQADARKQAAVERAARERSARSADAELSIRSSVSSEKNAVRVQLKPHDKNPHQRQQDDTDDYVKFRERGPSLATLLFPQP